MKTIELLAPAGNYEKMETALYFGADAVYLSGKQFGLRAFSDNFEPEEIKKAVDILHKNNKKAYVTVNIFAHEKDFAGLDDYLRYLQSIQIDAIIVSDPGILLYAQKYAPGLKLHLSTQANTTNKYSAAFWAEAGVERIVLARELTLPEISEIRQHLPDHVVLEAFVHGAMCMAYSGRCLLSNYLSGRSSNGGQCVQSCRWEYALMEKTRGGQYLPIEEDARGSYILNSKDLCMIGHLDRLKAAGVESFKIEGRMKSAYYVGCIVNAYRRAIDRLYAGKPSDPMLLEEVYKTGHRQFCTGFYLGDEARQCYETSKPKQDFAFAAVVLHTDPDGIWVEMRNRFRKGDVLEVLSPTAALNRTITIDRMTDESHNEICDVLLVQQKVKIFTGMKLHKQDILRKRMS